MADEKDDLEIGVSVNASRATSGARTAKSAISSVDSLSKDLQRSYRALKSSIDPTFAAQERYNKSIDNYKRLLKEGLVTEKEYRAARRQAKKDLDEQVASLARNTTAFKAAAAAKKQADSEAATNARRAAREEQDAARETARVKMQAAREARRVQQAAEQEELRAIRNAATAARQAAASANKTTTNVSRPSVVRSVQPGSIQTDKSLAQLEYAYRRTYAAAEAASQRAATAAAAAADASNAKQAASAQARAEREKQSAEDYAARATQLRQTIASVEKQQSAEATEADRQARAQQKQLARDAAASAVNAAKLKRQAEREAAEETRRAAQLTRQLAQEERRQNQALMELRASLDPNVAAQQRYNQTMATATALLMQNKLKQGEWIAIQKQAKAQMDVNVRSMGRMNNVYVQMGYQAQDVTASLASGINPLVILAQQGGQTASALSQMGGKVGQVAAFMAGPWGAAILGATMALGFLWQSMQAGEKSTKDLMNAEDRRTMSVKELTTAIRDYTSAQEKANQTTMQSKLNDQLALQQSQSEIIERMTKAQQNLTDARKAWNIASKAQGAGPIGAAAAAAAFTAMKYAESQVKQLQQAYDDAKAGNLQAAAAYAQTMSGLSEMEKREQMERTAALGSFTRDWKSAGDDRMKQTEAQLRYEKELTRIQELYVGLKKEEKKTTEDIFSTREKAIGLAGKELQKAGYNVGENFQFGRVGNHPGMGRQAHGQYAIDINMPGIGNESADPIAKARMDKMVAAYQARGFRVLWNGKVYEPNGGGASYDIRPGANQHRDHAHMEAPASIVGKPTGKGLGTQLANDQRQAEEQARKDAQESAIAEIEFKKEMAGEDLATVLELQDQKIASLKAFYGADSREALTASREKLRIEQQNYRQINQIKQEALNQQLQIDQQALANQQAVADAAMTLESKRIDFMVNNEMISQAEGVARRAMILQQTYEQQRQHEDQMYRLKVDSLNKSLALDNLLPSERRRINLEIQTAERQHNQTLFTMQQGYTASVQDLAIQAAQIQEDQWKSLGSTLESSLGSVFTSLANRQISLFQGFIQVGDAMVASLMQAGAKAVSQWIIQQARMLLVKKATDTANTASTVASQAAQTAAVVGGQTAQTAAKVGAAATESTVIAATTGAKVASEAVKTGAAVAGAATQTSVGAAAGMTEIGTRAATSAAGAFSSTVVIPFIGPVAAPVAAAAALAAVMGFGALISARGGQERVPFDGQMTELHKDEMVLPAYIANPLRASLSAPSSTPMLASTALAGQSALSMMSSTNNTGGDVNFNYSPKMTQQTASMSDLLRSEGRVMRKWLLNEARNGSLAGVIGKKK